MPHDVFISHSNVDKPVADAVCNRLETAGIRCWIAPRDISPGDDWSAAIMEGISGSRVLVLIFSAKANGSKHVQREVQRACDRELAVIPFRVENVLPTGGMEYYLGSVHWLDALTPPLERHLEKMVDRVKRLVVPADAPAVLAVEAPPAPAATEQPIFPSPPPPTNLDRAELVLPAPSPPARNPISAEKKTVRTDFPPKTDDSTRVPTRIAPEVIRRKVVFRDLGIIVAFVFLGLILDFSFVPDRLGYHRHKEEALAHIVIALTSIFLALIAGFVLSGWLAGKGHWRHLRHVLANVLILEAIPFVGVFAVLTVQPSAILNALDPDGQIQVAFVVFGVLWVITALVTLLAFVVGGRLASRLARRSSA